MSKVHTSSGQGNYKLFPQGTYQFDITDEPKLQSNIKGNPYKWFFKDVKTGEEFTPLLFQFGDFPMQDLLRALGYQPDDKNEYDWDTEEVVGKRFETTIIHQLITLKSGQDKTVERLTEIHEI